MPTERGKRIASPTNNSRAPAPTAAQGMIFVGSLDILEVKRAFNMPDERLGVRAWRSTASPIVT